MEAPSTEHKSSVFVIGGNSLVGQKIVHELCCGANKEKFEVNAVISPESDKSALEECKCEIIECSAESVDEVKARLGQKKLRQVVLALRSDQDNLTCMEHYLTGLKELNAEYVLLLSEPCADKENTILGKEFHQVEKMVEKMGLNYTILRTMFFIDNLALYAKDIKSNKRLALPLSKKGYFAALQTRDVADAVCTILCDCQKHHGQTYEITGPKTKNGSGLAKALSKVLGQDIKYQECSVNELKAQLKSHGASEAKIEGIVSFYDAANKSAFYYVTSDFKDITGRDPGKIQDYLVQNRHVFTEAREE